MQEFYTENITVLREVGNSIYLKTMYNIYYMLT